MNYDISLHLDFKEAVLSKDGQQTIKVPSKEKVDRSFHMMQELGITNFNTWCNDAVFPESETEDSYLSELLQAKMKETAIAMSSFHFVGSVLDCYDKDQQRIREYMERSLRIFGACEPKCFVVHPGTFDEGGFTCNKTAHKAAADIWGEEKTYQLLVDNLAYFGEVASKYKIQIAVENLFGGRFYSKIDELVKLVADVDHDNVGFCFDTGHANLDKVCLGDVIQKMGSKLFEVHLHDNFGDRDAHMPVGFGNINWLEVLNALDAVSYLGTASFEFFRWPLHQGKGGVEMSVAMWRNLEHIACCGYQTTELG